MPWRIQHNRSASRSLPGQQARRSTFERLAAVTVRNFYFPGGEVTDAGMHVEPDPFTAEQMQSMGLLLVVEADGFTIASDTRGARYARLRERHAAAESSEYLRFGFAIRFEDSLFVNYSDLPFDLGPRSALYVDTLDRSGDHEVTVTGKDALPVRHNKFRADFIEDAAFLVIYNVLGERVLCYPRSVRPAAARAYSPDQLACKDYDPDGIFRNSVYVDLSGLPDGKYQQVFYDEHWKQVGPRLSWVYLFGTSNPLLFIELIISGFGKGVEPQLDYQIVFDARPVGFVYVVVPPPDDRYSHLRIKSTRPEGLRFDSREIEFQGRPAVEFRASEPLRLQQVPHYEMSLWGHDRRSRSERELVSRLPVPGPAHLTRDPPTRLGEIVSTAYVYI